MDDPRFDEFFTEDYYRVVSTVALITGDRDVAAEAVAEAIARAWEQHKRGVKIESLAAWTRIVAINVARGSFRRRAAEQRARDRLNAARVEPVTGVTDDASDVLAVLAELSRREREVVVLHYFEDLTVPEIADVLGLRVAGVKSCLKRARRRLAAIMRRPEVEAAFREMGR